MTGFQIHPGSDVQEENLRRVDIEEIVKSIGPDFYMRADATNIQELIDVLHSTVTKDGLKVLLLESVCRLEEARRKPVEEGVSFKVDKDLCKGENCLICVHEFACPAIGWEKEIGHPVISDQMCVLCGACIEVCPHDAIKEVSDK